jgi:hypothetical protein
MESIVIEPIENIHDTSNKCYVCFSEVGQLLRPCVNQNCNARICKECLVKQVKIRNENSRKCGICRENIAVRKGPVNKYRCFEKYLKVFYVWFMLLGGSVLTFLNAFGKSVGWHLIDCGYVKEGPCDSGLAGTFFLTIPFLMIFWQGHIFEGCGRYDRHLCCNCYGSFNFCCAKGKGYWRYNIFCCGNLKKTLKYKSYITMFVMFLFANSLITIAHCIGYPIILHQFSKDEFYTWRTSLAGFVVYIIAIATGLLSWLIYGIYKCLLWNAENQFSEDEYGVVVIENETTTLV